MYFRISYRIAREFFKNLLWLQSSFRICNPDWNPGWNLRSRMFKGLQIEISTLIATTISEPFRVAIRVANHNPESQPEGPKIRNPEVFSMVAIRVAIAISQPWNIMERWLQQGCNKGCDFNSQPWNSGDDQVATRVANHNMKHHGCEFSVNSQPWAFFMVVTMVSISIETSYSCPWTFWHNCEDSGTCSGTRSRDTTWFVSLKFRTRFVSLSFKPGTR